MLCPVFVRVTLPTQKIESSISTLVLSFRSAVSFSKPCVIALCGDCYRKLTYFACHMDKTRILDINQSDIHKYEGGKGTYIFQLIIWLNFVLISYFEAYKTDFTKY